MSMDVLKFGKVVLELRKSMDKSEALRKVILSGSFDKKDVAGKLEAIDIDMKREINALVTALTGDTNELFDNIPSVVDVPIENDVVDDTKDLWSDDDLADSVESMHQRNVPLWKLDGYIDESSWVKDKLMESIDEDFMDINTPDDFNNDDTVLEDSDVFNELSGNASDFVKGVASVNLDIKLPEIKLD